MRYRSHESGMQRYNCTLPSHKSFFLLRSEDGWHRWVDSSTSQFQIICQDKEPWDKVWAITPVVEAGETSGGLSYPQRLVLKCLPPEGELNSVRLVREKYKSNFCHSPQNSVEFWGFPLDREVEESDNWLTVSLIPSASLEEVGETEAKVKNLLDCIELAADTVSQEMLIKTLKANARDKGITLGKLVEGILADYLIE